MPPFQSVAKWDHLFLYNNKGFKYAAGNLLIGLLWHEKESPGTHALVTHSLLGGGGGGV